jgi:hypothetical protein
MLAQVLILGALWLLGIWHEEISELADIGSVCSGFVSS